MSDLKLFKLNKNKVEELKAVSFTLEKSLQTLIESNLEEIFGIKFLDTEYSTGKEHGGRIDTLGIDENNCPIIIEYKRSIDENVITQGLFYLDWLMDHQAEFKLLVIEKLGKDYTEKIEWTAPRLLCIANNFTKYDEHAVKQMNRNIELIRYKKYDKDMLLFELVNSQTATEYIDADNEKKSVVYKTFGEYLKQADKKLTDLYHSLELKITTIDNFEKTKHLIIKSYEMS